MTIARDSRDEAATRRQDRKIYKLLEAGYFPRHVASLLNLTEADVEAADERMEDAEEEAAAAAGLDALHLGMLLAHKVARREAMRAWRRSVADGEETVKTTANGEGERTKTERTQQQHPGDVRYIAQAHRSLAEGRRVREFKTTRKEKPQAEPKEPAQETPPAGAAAGQAAGQSAANRTDKERGEEVQKRILLRFQREYPDMHETRLLIQQDELAREFDPNYVEKPLMIPPPRDALSRCRRTGQPSVPDPTPSPAAKAAGIPARRDVPSAGCPVDQPSAADGIRSMPATFSGVDTS